MNKDLMDTQKLQISPNPYASWNQDKETPSEKLPKAPSGSVTDISHLMEKQGHWMLKFRADVLELLTKAKEKQAHVTKCAIEDKPYTGKPVGKEFLTFGSKKFSTSIVKLESFSGKLGGLVKSLSTRSDEVDKNHQKAEEFIRQSVKALNKQRQEQSAIKDSVVSLLESAGIDVVQMHEVAGAIEAFTTDFIGEEMDDIQFIGLAVSTRKPTQMLGILNAGTFTNKIGILQQQYNRQIAEVVANLNDAWESITRYAQPENKPMADVLVGKVEAMMTEAIAGMKQAEKFLLDLKAEEGKENKAANKKRDELEKMISEQQDIIEKNIKVQDDLLQLAENIKIAIGKQNEKYNQDNAEALSALEKAQYHTS